MIAEIVRAVRGLKRPFRPAFWLPKNRNNKVDQPGVLLLSFAGLSEAQRTRLAKSFSHHQVHQLLDASLPPLSIDEHLEKDSPGVAVYRVFFFFWRTLLGLFGLLRGKRSLARHLTETDDLARVQAGIRAGYDFLHLSTLQYSVVGQTKALKRLVSSTDTRRYEFWLVDRSRKECLLPPTLAIPEAPLSSRELVSIARSYPCLKSRTGRHRRHPKADGCFRIMTYNLHSCIGLDGRTSIQRIAEVLHRYQPDFVALQEIDVGCARSGHTDQLRALQELWPSEGVFFPILAMRGGSYGIGFLSRVPVVRWEGTVLPMSSQTMPQEPRAVLKISVQPNGWSTPITIFNTHLGLTRKERLAHLGGIADQGSATDARCQVLIGDFNCSPQSPEYKRIVESWTPSQEKPAKTWFGTFPLRHLDYCFIRGPLIVTDCWAPRDSHTRVASDHLPLITDLKLIDS